MDWEAAITIVLTLPLHARYRVPRHVIDCPTDAGFYTSTGLQSCKRHYRLPLPDGRGIHVHAHERHYDIHWDRFDPKHSLTRHLIVDVAFAAMRGLRRVVRRIPLEPVAVAPHS